MAHAPLAETGTRRLLMMERRAKVIELRRQRYSLREIAATLNCAPETARRDIAHYMSAIDQTCLETTAAMRAELAQEYDEIISTLSREVADGHLDRVESLLKATRELRQLYALDVVPLNRSELQLRRTVITEIATKLRDQLTPELFAEVATCLVADEPFQLLDGVAIASGDETATEPTRPIGKRPRPKGSTGAEGTAEGLET